MISNIDSEPSAAREFVLSAAKIKDFSEVIYYGQIPIFPDSNSYQQSRLIWQAPYIAPKSYPVAAMDQSSLLSGEVQKNIAKKLKVGYVDLIEVFCDPKNCLRFKNGNWLYFDTSHLSVQGAELLYNYSLRFFIN